MDNEEDVDLNIKQIHSDDMRKEDNNRKPCPGASEDGKPMRRKRSATGFTSSSPNTEKPPL